MVIKNTKKRMSWCASALGTLLITAALAACDASAPNINGNVSAPAGDAGSQPQANLTFSVDPQLSSNGHSQPGNSALRSTLASTTIGSFNDLQVLVFGPMCSGCHMGGGRSQPSIMDFTTADASYAALVNRSSTASPNRTLVVPGNADGSYLLASLEGRQTVGSRMPMRAAPMSEELVNAVRTWIDSGARR